MPLTTAIRGAAVLAFDGEAHHLVTNGTVVFTDDLVVHAGGDYAGEVDRTIDASNCLLIPGLINLHSHGGIEAGGRLILDCGRPDGYNSGFINYWTTQPGATPIYLREDPAIGARHYLVECLLHGATTVVDVGGGSAELVDAARELGVRIFTSPGFASAKYIDSTGTIDYDWDEGRGKAQLDAAIAFIREHADGDLINGMLCPHAVDTCSAELLGAALDAARDLGVSVQIHAAQGLFEVGEMMRRTKHTPIGWLEAEGLLGPDLILGHAIFMDHHPLVAAQGRSDLANVAAAGSPVAHNPLVFARRGWALNSFQRYIDAGVTVGIGTDTCPRNLIDEMRWASYVCKLVEGDLTAGQPADVFNATTLQAAKALRRPDLGRLAPGSKADVVAIRLDRVGIGPVLDPMKSLIHYGGEYPAEYVIVNGRTVVDGGAVTGVDEVALMKEVQTLARRLWAETPQWDPQQRQARDLCPPAFQ